MISRDVAIWYVIIICLQILHGCLQEKNLARAERKCEGLRAEKQELQKDNKKLLFNLTAQKIENEKVTKDLEATTRELKVAEEIIEKAGVGHGAAV